MFRMRRTDIWLSVVLLALMSAPGLASSAVPGPGSSQEGTESGENVVVIRTGTLIADPAGEPVANGIIVVRGDQIVAVGAEQDVDVPDGAEEIDLGNLTVLPGLIDSHTHLDTGGFFSAQQPSLPLAAMRAAAAMRRAVEVGVTTMRVVANFGFVDVALRDAVNEGLIVGPRVIPAGHALSIPGGHGDFWSFPADFPMQDMYSPLNGFISSPADAERAVQLQVKYGAEVIKVSASGGVGSPIDFPFQQQVSPAELEAIASMAHRLGLKATAHAENAASIKAAVRAGFDSIDHASELDDEAIRLIQENGTFLVPTLFVVVNLLENGEAMGIPANVLVKAQQLADKHFPSFQKAHNSGLRIAAGSDMSYAADGGTLIDELRSEVDYGMTPRQALITATVSGADNVGLASSIGRLEVGMQADLIAVTGDPLGDINALDNVAFVMRAGQILVSTVEGVSTDAGR